MTPEERFDKIEEALEDLTDIVRMLANGQQGLQEQQSTLQEQQARSQIQIDALAEAQRNTNETQRIVLESFGTMIQSQTQIIERIDEIAAEVRGLQLENRRMIERFFGEDTP